jgi:hypothetical protein
MALTKNQLEAIESAVNTGKELPPALSSALLAAYLCESKLAEQLRVQKSQETIKAQSLSCERDETLRVKANLELEIEQRVELRTKFLREQLTQAEHESNHCRDQRRYAEEVLCRQETAFKQVRENYDGIILRMSKLLQQKMNPTVLSRFIWNRRAKEVLKDAGLGGE